MTYYKEAQYFKKEEEKEYNIFIDKEISGKLLSSYTLLQKLSDVSCKNFVGSAHYVEKYDSVALYIKTDGGIFISLDRESLVNEIRKHEMI